jgi:hypothetical protein
MNPFYPVYRPAAPFHEDSAGPSRQGLPKMKIVSRENRFLVQIVLQF